ncbi:MAG TPA: 4Fe-4S binding protein [bacterium]|nr:4Fe-4S binding protein [bacterium]HOM27145.1 4Fe-4S binding protein [bacterium]
MYKKTIKYFFKLLIQGVFIFLFFYFFKKTKFPLSEKLPLNFFFRIDLLFAIFTTISTLHFSYLFLPSIIILFLLLFLGNFFCFWVCPLGGIIDYANIIFLRKKWKIGIKIPKWVRYIKVFIFWAIIFTSFTAIFLKIPFLFWMFDPYVILMRGLLFKKILIILIVIIFLNILIPRFWCYYICPFGYLNYLIGVKLRNKIKRKIKK